MIIGGWNDDSMDGLTSVELFNWKTGEQCQMPSGKPKINILKRTDTLQRPIVTLAIFCLVNVDFKKYCSGQCFENEES